MPVGGIVNSFLKKFDFLLFGKSGQKKTMDGSAVRSSHQRRKTAPENKKSLLPERQGPPESRRKRCAQFGHRCGPLSFFSVHGVARAHGPNGPGDQGIQIPTQHGGSARDDIPRAAGRKLFILVLLFYGLYFHVVDAFGGAHQRYSAMTAQAPADSAIFACSGVVTSMMTPP